MLNSASTIFTMDVYKRYMKKDASPGALVTTGRVTTLILVVIGCLIAPQLGNPKFKGIFNYIQEFQGFVSPGILAAFVFGMIFKRAPANAGLAALILSPLIYGILLIVAGDIAFLNRMAITFGVILMIMWVMTKVDPLPEDKVMPVREGFDDRPDPKVVWMGVGVVVVTLALYVVFW